MAHNWSDFDKFGLNALPKIGCAYSEKGPYNFVWIDEDEEDEGEGWY